MLLALAAPDVAPGENPFPPRASADEIAPPNPLSATLSALALPPVPLKNLPVPTPLPADALANDIAWPDPPDLAVLLALAFPPAPALSPPDALALDVAAPAPVAVVATLVAVALPPPPDNTSRATGESIPPAGPPVATAEETAPAEPLEMALLLASASPPGPRSRPIR